MQSGTQRKARPGACLSCKSSHVSCDNGRPCGRCIRLGRECVTKPNKRARNNSSDGFDAGEHSSPLSGSQSELEVFGGFVFTPTIDTNQGWFQMPEETNNRIASHSQVVDKLIFTPPTCLTDKSTAGNLAEGVRLFVERAKIIDRNELTYRLANARRHIDESPIPCILLDGFSKLRYVNSAFQTLTNLPYPLEHTTLLDVFDFSVNAIRLLSWVSFTSHSQKVIPCYLKIWSPGTDFKTQQRHGQTYVEGVLWMESEIGNGQVPYCSSMYFMPSPGAVS
ncbi:hypothetical protein PROFUN_05337 [Planoprotostelium fungivorum]|uniref:Zn(2)-C6 fungal-type domain-containing protein n=1 Tax=Planoprotostelium fungivorum TaxID=1890364 RepID=A0A2P6NRB3_9EUKA|nr:hypothetical protein PROFUN_05337 [Planoprotostelium fungivorum]